MKRPAQSNRSGFTLLEVMFGGALLAVGIVGMMQVLGTGTQMLDTARKQAVAMRLIHGEIDRMRLADWSQVTSISNNVDTATVNAGNATQLVYTSSTPVSLRTVDAVVTVDSSFRIKRTLSDVSGRTNFKQVTFEVSWNSNTGRLLKRTGYTYISKEGLNVSYRR